MIGSFRARTRGLVTVYEYSDFVASDFIGSDLLLDCFGFDGMRRRFGSFWHVHESNNLLIGRYVEDNYLRSFMGLDSASAVIQHIEWSEFVFRKRLKLPGDFE